MAQAVVRHVAEMGDMERVSCPLCAADEARPLCTVRDHLFARPGEFSLVDCGACGLTYLNPRPTLAGLARYYPDDYFCYQPALGSARMGGLTRALAVQRIRQLERHVGRIAGDARVLDVGCGANAFLYHLQRLRNCSTLGIDTNAAVVRAVSEHLGMPAVEGTLTGAGLEAESFDGVAMYEYIEHEGNPRAVLAEARRVTRPGGWLALETPNIASGLAKVFGRKWCQLDAPRHLVLYTPATLTRLLNASGYEVIAVRRLCYQWMIGFSMLVALGMRNMGRLRMLDMALGVAATLPVLPLPWLFPEFMRVYARRTE